MPVAIYSRVSTEEQKQGENIEAHIAELKTLMDQEGNFLWHKKHGIYKDEGYTGAIIARPDLDRLRDDAKLGRYKKVYFLETGRVARVNHAIGLVVNELRAHGVDIRFKKTPVTNDAEGDLMLNIYGSFAEYERSMIADRCRRGQRYKAEVRKLIVGSNAPYGFQYIKKDKENNKEGYYKKRPDQIVIVQKMFELVDCNAYTARKLAKWLTDAGIPTPRGKKVWSVCTVVTILHRTEYIGIAYYNKRERVLPTTPRHNEKYKRQLKTSLKLRPKEEWIAIPVPECRCVDHARFQRVQERLAANKIFAKRNTKHFYLLARLLRCAEPCGCTWGCRQSGDHRRYYDCRNRNVRYPLPRTCNARVIKADVVDDFVWRAFCKMVLEPALLMKHVAKLQQKYKGRSEIEQQTELEKQAIRTLERTEKRVFAAYKAGIIDIEKLNSELAPLRDRMETHQQRLDRLMREKRNVLPVELVKDDVLQYRDYIRNQLKVLKNDPEKRQQAIRTFFREGIVKKDSINFKCVIPKCGSWNGQNNERTAAFVETTLERYLHKNRDSSYIGSPEVSFKMKIDTKTGAFGLCTF